MSPPLADQPQLALLVSASMGAGHDLAAAELGRRLEAMGYRTRTEDYLAWFPLRIGLLLRWIYGQQLKVAPWTYEATFKLWILIPLMCRVLEVILGVLTGRRMRRLVADSDPAVIVCAYPLQAMVLGRLRRKGRIEVPLVTFITDFGVHPLWMHEGVDLTVCVWEGAARVASASTSRAVISTGPMVAPSYAAGPLPKAVARAGLGLPQQACIALVVAGSWGVGDIEATFAELWATGRYLPVAVCGRNEAVRQSLAAKGYGVVLGWTDRMHELMSAADVLVQNAGGLSCMEAFSLDLPVVTYHPIAGHGRKNASEMVAAGVTLLATGPDDLGAVLDRATGPERAALVAAGRAVFTGDPAAEVARLARIAGEDGEPRRVPPPARPAPGTPRGSRPGQRPHRRRRRMAGAALALASTYVGLNLCVDAATAHGLDAARAEAGAQEVYVAVRLGPAALSDPGLGQVLAADHVTAVVAGRLAATEPAAVRRLSRSAVDLATDGWLDRQPLHLVQPTDDLLRSTQAIRLDTGLHCRDFTPASGVSGADLASALMAHLRIVRTSLFLPIDSVPGVLKAGHVYMLGATTASAAAVEASLGELTRRAARDGLGVAPLSDLR